MEDATLGLGSFGDSMNYSIRMKTLLHEIFAEDAQKEYETISALIDVVGDQVPGGEPLSFVVGGDSVPRCVRFTARFLTIFV